VASLSLSCQTWVRHKEDIVTTNWQDGGDELTTRWDDTDPTGSERVIEAASGHAIITLSPPGRIVSWPEPAHQFYQYTDDDVVGEHVAKLWASETDAAEVESLLERARSAPVDVEAWHERADASVFWATSTITPIRNDTFHGYTMVTQDTTARKQYERMLERQNDRLKEFSDILSHDLRNPLNVVEGRVSLYRQTGDEEHLDIVEETTGRMERLIEDLLRIARQGDVVRDPQPTPLAEVLRAAAQGTLPDTASLVVDSAPTVMGDKDRLCQMFENLLRNAVEHAGSDVVVRVGRLPDGFSIEDDGPGIPDADRDDVFDHGFTTADDGNGFGLSLVRTIVGAHGWDVTAVEGSDGGARFEITNVELLDD
jgi:PAS domain S-box-containing protein